jgi:hypothetical protein
MTLKPGLQLRATFVALSVLALGQKASAIDNTCYYKVSQVATITTYGEIRNPDGTTSYVPMGGVTYVYYDVECTGEGMYPGTEPGGPSYTPLKPKVALKSIDTTDPTVPLLVVDVDFDPYAPATTLTVSVGGVTIQQLPLAWTGEYEVALRSVDYYSTAGTKAITAKVCTPANVCTTASGSMSRASPSPLSKGETMTARYVIGDDGWQYASYGHQFNQSYMTTSFSMAELGQNSRRQLRNSFIKLQWGQDMYDAAFMADIYTGGTLYGHSAAAQANCAYVPPCVGYCMHRCVDSHFFGFMPVVEDQIHDMVKTNSWMPISITFGGKLRHQLP